MSGKADASKQTIPDAHLSIAGYGTGIVTGVESLTTFLPILHYPYNDVYDIALFQGGVTVSAVENGLAMKWNSPYVFYLNDKVRMYPPDSSLENRWERNAFHYARHVYEDVLQALSVFKTREPELNGANVIEIVADELRSLEDSIYLNLITKYSRIFRLRSDEGHYKWMGLETISDQGVKPVTTPIVIPRLIEGNRSIYLRASDVPYVPDSDIAMTTMQDNCMEAVICGLIHAFEHQPQYFEECAIRAALLTWIFKGDFTLEKMLAAASRANFFPRLASKDDTGMYMWRRLAALGI